MVEVNSPADRPRVSALGASLLLHALGLAIVILAWYPKGPRVAAVPLQAVNFNSERTGPLTFDKSGTGGKPIQIRKNRVIRSRAATKTTPTSAGTGEGVQQEAKRETAAMMRDLKFRSVWGFSAGHEYQLPVQQSEMPRITAEQVPSQYAQMVVIDLTIDSAGKVVEAEIVGGEINASARRVVLAVVSELRYIPAKRDNVPVASQLEIVIPVPS